MVRVVGLNLNNRQVDIRSNPTERKLFHIILLTVIFLFYFLYAVQKETNLALPASVASDW